VFVKTYPELSQNYRARRETIGLVKQDEEIPTPWIPSDSSRWGSIVSISKKTVNPEVAGSSPVEPAMKSSSYEGAVTCRSLKLTRNELTHFETEGRHKKRFG